MMKITKAMLPNHSAVLVQHEHATNGLMFVCEHASNFIPAELNQLGLDDTQIVSHIAWDPGALKVAQRLSDAFQCPLIASAVSRLVYDCNRPPTAASAMPDLSEVHVIPGNQNLSESEKASRVAQVYQPFVEAVDGVSANQLRQPDLPLFVTIHSFVPVYNGQARDVQIGILHDQDARLADCLIAESGHLNDYVVRRNEPYSPVDGVTHTLQDRAMVHGFANVMIEIRNDLISDEAGIKKVADYLERLLRACLPQCQFPNPHYQKA